MNNAVKWPTPRAEERQQSNSQDNGVALSKAVQQWPTPRAYSHGEESNVPGLTSLDVVVRELYPDKARYWPTPMVPNGGRSPKTNPRESGQQLHLEEAVRIWPTPSATDYKGSNKIGQRRGQLSEATEVLWPTPTTSDGMGGPGNAGRGGGSNLRTEVAAPGGQLNPAWVAQLQGAPDGWLDLSRDVPDQARIDAATNPRWPAGMGQPQHDFEHPRVGRGIKDRSKALRALGNANPCAQAYPIFAAIMACEGTL